MEANNKAMLEDIGYNTDLYISYIANQENNTDQRSAVVSVKVSKVYDA